MSEPTTNALCVAGHSQNGFSRIWTRMQKTRVMKHQPNSYAINVVLPGTDCNDNILDSNNMSFKFINQNLLSFYLQFPYACFGWRIHLQKGQAWRHLCLAFCNTFFLAFVLNFDEAYFLYKTHSILLLKAYV